MRNEDGAQRQIAASTSADEPGWLRQAGLEVGLGLDTTCDDGWTGAEAFGGRRRGFAEIVAYPGRRMQVSDNWGGEARGTGGRQRAQRSAIRRAERDAAQPCYAGDGVRRQMSIAEGDVSRAASRGWAQLHEETRKWAAACQVRRIWAAKRIQVAWRAAVRQSGEGKAEQEWAELRLVRRALALRDWAATCVQAVVRGRSMRRRTRGRRLMALVMAGTTLQPATEGDAAMVSVQTHAGGKDRKLTSAGSNWEHRQWWAATRLQTAARAWQARLHLRLLREAKVVVVVEDPEEGARDEAACVARSAAMAKAGAQAKVRDALRARERQSIAARRRGMEGRQERQDRRGAEELRRRETAEELGRLMCSTDADQIESSLHRLQAAASLGVRAEARVWVAQLRGMERAKREECLRDRRHAVALQALVKVQDRTQLERAAALISALPAEESRQVTEEMQAALSRVEWLEQRAGVVERAKRALRRVQGRTQLEQSAALISALPVEESMLFSEEMHAARSRVERQEQRSRRERRQAVLVGAWGH